MSLVTQHPFKAIFTLLVVAWSALQFPFWILYNIPPSLRPHKSWSLRQAIGVRIIKTYLWTSSTVQMKTPTSLGAGLEGKKWAVVKPAAKKYYTGPVNVDSEIVPTTVGGTWYPQKPTGKPEGLVALHFHGGAFVIGDGRTLDAGFAARTLLKNTPVQHVFAPQYRLACNPGGRFPSSLQDVITFYVYLIEEMGVSPDRIIISGDSAGGNLTLAMVRYLTEFGDKIGLQKPLAAWLWSPWVSPCRSVTDEAFLTSPNLHSDYIVSNFAQWGALTYMPAPSTGLTLEHDYISFQHRAFETSVPIYITAGEAEILFHDIVELAEQMQAIKANKITFDISEYAVHDIILIGHISGFIKEADLMVKQGGDWLKSKVLNS